MVKTNYKIGDGRTLNFRISGRNGVVDIIPDAMHVVEVDKKNVVFASTDWHTKYDPVAKTHVLYKRSVTYDISGRTPKVREFMHLVPETHNTFQSDSRRRYM